MFIWFLGLVFRASTLIDPHCWNYDLCDYVIIMMIKTNHKVHDTLTSTSEHKGFLLIKINLFC